ncbi:hypothetical protein ABWH96_11290 [Marivirga tractuosa]|uniref:hypothetical protein n=1 Tax=Marivirga tractuosa TaxID=1006 RepID=UPI0035CEA588
MKNIFFILISLFIFSCSTQKVLKTDTQDSIDLSGRWNDTDAEIATSELFNNLITSSWMKNHQAENNLEPRIEIQEFESNFKNGGEKLSKYFTQYAKSDGSVNLVKGSKEKLPEYQLSGRIDAEEFVTESQNYIDYRITAQLKNLEGEIQWEDKTTIKKYIKD